MSANQIFAVFFVSIYLIAIATVGQVVELQRQLKKIRAQLAVLERMLNR